MEKNYCRNSLYCNDKLYSTCQRESYCRYKLTSSHLIKSNLDDFSKIIHMGCNPIHGYISIQFKDKEVMMFEDNMSTFYKVNNIEKFEDMYSLYQFIFNYYKKLLNGIVVEKKLEFEWYEYVFDNCENEPPKLISDELYPNLKIENDDVFLPLTKEEFYKILDCVNYKKDDLLKNKMNKTKTTLEFNKIDSEIKSLEELKVKLLKCRF